MRHKHLAEWAEAYGARRHRRRASLGREPWSPRALSVFAAAAQLVDRAARRNRV